MILDSVKNLLSSGSDYKNYFYEAEFRKYDFAVKYDSLIIHDKLLSAKALIDDKLKDRGLSETVTGEKRFYQKYAADLEQRFKEDDLELKVIISSSRKFKKKYFALTKQKTLDAFLQADELITRCYNYSKRTGLELKNHVVYYNNYTKAKIIDLNHKEDLERSAKRKKFFLKSISEYESSEDMREYINGLNYIDSLILFIKTAPANKTKIKRNVVMGEKYKLQRLIEKEKEFLSYDRTIALSNDYGVDEFGSDTLNPGGIFVFNDNILVIKSFYSRYNSNFLILGDGKQEADKMLVRYADQNDGIDKHSKANERVKGGELIPYFIDGSLRKFYSSMGVYQIRVSYKLVRNRRFTEELKNSLRPITIDTNYMGLVNEYYDKDRQIQFYRNKEGSFVRLMDKDSVIIIADYDDKNYVNTKNEDHSIDFLQIIDRRKRRKPVSKKYYFNINKGIDEKYFELYRKYQNIFNKEYIRARDNFYKTQK